MGRGEGNDGHVYPRDLYIDGTRSENQYWNTIMGGLVVASNNELQLPVECREWDNEGSDFEYTLNLYTERDIQSKNVYWTTIMDEVVESI